MPATLTVATAAAAAADAIDEAEPLPLAGLTLDRRRGQLLDSQGRRVELRRQTMAVLLELARRPGEVVSKQALFDAVWRGRVVTDDSLVQCVLEIRRTLGPSGAALLRTLPRRGYVLESTWPDQGPPAPEHVPGHVPVAGVAGLELCEAAPARREPPPPELAFVGRHGELFRLAAMARAPAETAERVLLIEGEPGIGRSRLLAEGLRLAAAHGRATVALRCFEIEARVANVMLARLVGQLVERADAPLLRKLDAVSRAELAALVPAAAARLAPLAGLGGESAEIRLARRVAALVALAHALAAGPGLVIGIDDAQWVDAASALVLHALAESAARAPLLLWATLPGPPRHARAAALYEALLGHAHVARVVLPRLAAAEIGQLARQVFGDAADATELAATLARESEGNPMFVHELIRASTCRLDGGAQGASRAGAARQPEASPALPVTLVEAVCRHLDHLSLPGRRLLEAAAVAGPGTDFEWLRRLAGQARGPALDALDELLAEGWLVHRGDVLVFTHNGLREAVRVALCSARRQALLRRAACIGSAGGTGGAT
ncbi:MAG: AAA family ATPase [Rubrivivax sp.]|nr:AAA family ATPase [Rubrivivax sp.]